MIKVKKKQLILLKKIISSPQASSSPSPEHSEDEGYLTGPGPDDSPRGTPPDPNSYLIKLQQQRKQMREKFSASLKKAMHTVRDATQKPFDPEHVV